MRMLRLSHLNLQPPDLSAQRNNTAAALHAEVARWQHMPGIAWLLSPTKPHSSHTTSLFRSSKDTSTAVKVHHVHIVYVLAHLCCTC